MRSRPAVDVTGFFYDLNDEEDCEWTITDVLYTPGRDGNWDNPPEPAEIEFNEMYRTNDPTKLVAHKDGSISPKQLEALTAAAEAWLYEEAASFEPEPPEYDND